MPAVAAVLILLGDLIVKKDGETIDCIVVSQDRENVVYRVPTGTRVLPMSMVASVERKKTLANKYEAAAFYIRPGDSLSYYALARWCDENDFAAPSALLYKMAGSEEKVAHLCYIRQALKSRDTLKKRSYLELALSLQPDDPAVVEALARGGAEQDFSRAVYLALAELVEEFVSRDFAGTRRKIEEFSSRQSPVEKAAVNLAMLKKLGFGLDELAERVEALIQQQVHLGGGKIRCAQCKGTKYVTCRGCRGMGYVNCPQCGGGTRPERGRPCPRCDGTGRANCKACTQSKYGRTISVAVPGGGRKFIQVNATGKRLCPRCGKFLRGLPREVVERAVPVTAAESKKLGKIAARMREKAKGGFAYEWDAAKPLGQLRQLTPAKRRVETLVFVAGRWLKPQLKKLHARISERPSREDAEWFETYRSKALGSDLGRSARKMSFDAGGLVAWEEFFERWLWTHGAYYERRKLFSAVFSAEKGYVPSPGGGVFVVREGIVLRPEPPLELPEDFTDVVLYFRVTDVEKKTAWEGRLPSLGWEVRIEPVRASARLAGKQVWSY